jgi:hypothetical protein
MVADAHPASIARAMPAEPPAQEVVDVHRVWERQLARLDTIDLRLADEPVLDAVCAAIARLEDLLLTTPARTREGAVAQIRRVATILAHGDHEAREQQGLRLALATLAELQAIPGRPAAAGAGRDAGGEVPREGWS